MPVFIHLNSIWRVGFCKGSQPGASVADDPSVAFSTSVGLVSASVFLWLTLPALELCKGEAVCKRSAVSAVPALTSYLDGGVMKGGGCPCVVLVIKQDWGPPKPKSHARLESNCKCLRCNNLSSVTLCIGETNCDSDWARQLTFLACRRSRFLHCLQAFLPYHSSSEEVAEPSRTLKTPSDTQNRSMLAKKVCFMEMMLGRTTKHLEALSAHLTNQQQQRHEYILCRLPYLQSEEITVATEHATETANMHDTAGL